jgi:hypothetical protein
MKRSRRQRRWARRTRPADPRDGKCRTCATLRGSLGRRRRRCLPEKRNRPTPGTTSNPAIEQGGCPGGVRGTRAGPRVRPLNNYRHPKFPRGVGALSILRCVDLLFGPTSSSLLGPLLLGFHCGQSSADCSQPCGDGRFLSYLLELRRLREDGFFRFRRRLGLYLFASLRLGADML